MEIVRVAARGSEDAEEAIRPFFPTVTFGSAGSRQEMAFDLRVHAAHGTTLLDYTIVAPRLRAATDMPGFTVSETSGDGAMLDGRDPIDWMDKPYAVPHQGMSAELERVHARAIQLDEEAVHHFVRVDLGDDALQVRSTGTAALTPAAGATWKAAAQYAEDRMLDGSADLPLIGASLSQLLVSTYLACFRTTWSDARAQRGETAPTSRAVRRAVAFIEDNRHLPIDSADIAQAARMSIRGLQAAFRRERGTTPMQHLRRARLDAARQDLLAADASRGDNVAVIAGRWGFAHLGRFAQTYSSAYGELPSSTLRR